MYLWAIRFYWIFKMVVVYLTPNEICRKDAKILRRKVKDKSHKETKQSNKPIYQRRSKYRTNWINNAWDMPTDAVAIIWIVETVTAIWWSAKSQSNFISLATNFHKKETFNLLLLYNKMSRWWKGKTIIRKIFLLSTSCFQSRNPH